MPKPPRSPTQALWNLASGYVDFKGAPGGPVTLDGVAFTEEQVVVMDRLGMRMSLRERLKRFMPRISSRSTKRRGACSGTTTTA